MKNKINPIRPTVPTIAVDPAPATAASVEKKPALWRRAMQAVKAVASSTVQAVKAASVSTAKAVAAPFRFVARKLSKPAGVVKSVVRRMYRAIVATMQKMSPGLRMFARVWAFGLWVGLWFGLLVAAPEACIILTFFAGLALIGLAKLVEYGDIHGGLVRRFVDMLDTVLWVVGWGFIGVLTVALLAVSPFHAILFVLMAAFWVVYRWPVESKTVFESVEEVTVVEAPARPRRWHPNMDTGFASLLEVVEPSSQAPQPSNDQRATSSMWECAACGTPNGSFRVNGWCTACFKALEDDFIAETNKRRNAEYTLDPSDYKEHLVAVRLSRQDADHVHWAETSWWVDRKGQAHPRTWTGFLQGSAIAHIDYHHSKDKHQRTYRAFLREVQIGTYWYFNTAKTAVVEYMVDVGYAVTGALQSAVKEEPAPQVSGMVLNWQTNS